MDAQPRAQDALDEITLGRAPRPSEDQPGQLWGQGGSRRDGDGLPAGLCAYCEAVSGGSASSIT